MCFKADAYDRSSGTSSTVGAQVRFHALTIEHSS